MTISSNLFSIALNSRLRSINSWVVDWGVLKVQEKWIILTIFFFFYWNLTKARSFRPLLESKLWIHNFTHQDRVLSNLDEFLIGIEPKIFESIVHPNPLTTKGPFGYSWKLKLKTEKYCSKIIFKCVNSIVGPIFNKKVVKK